ncbi:hypothetical protein M569_16053 [Genlisea aurea]|uniref:DUF7953 domain-containing protein n=1 Tax=Genlisea aurea TaxID=192259 RepID=S8BVW2_9LAMI|nr:hypothetical protein M569_16053 [Genlisea aurea]
MKKRRRFSPRSKKQIIFFWALLRVVSFPALISAAAVTLDSIEILNIHEWIPSDPTIFFRCKGENRTILPDVREKEVKYTFKGVESWQPLTELRDVKCKRCGLYEKTVIRLEEEYDEWELCPSDFTGSDGRYVHSKDKEFTATFLCSECASLAKGSKTASSDEQSDRSSRVEDDSDETPVAAAIVVVVILCVGFMILGSIWFHRWWRMRKRRQQQARFMKLFEDADEMDDELGIGPLSIANTL